MSYILDALRRSEQERHQEQLQSLAGHDNLIHVQKEKTQLWPYILIGVLVVNAVIFLWIHFENKAVLSETELRLSQVQESNERQADELEQRVEMPQDKTVSLEPVIDKTRRSVQSSIASDSRLPDAELNTAQKSQDYSQTPKYQASQNSQILQDKQPTLASNVTAEPELFHEVDPAPGEVYIDGALLIQPKDKSRMRAIPEPAKPTVTVSPVPITQEEMTPELDPYEDVAYLRDMGHSFQKKVPSLTFNSHIYSDIASARRVMINNVYLSEGQQLSGLEVVNIGEQDIVFSKNGQMFKQPVMRDW